MGCSLMCLKVTSLFLHYSRVVFQFKQTLDEENLFLYMRVTIQRNLTWDKHFFSSTKEVLRLKKDTITKLVVYDDNHR